MTRKKLIKKKKTFSLPYEVTDYIENNSTSQGYTESDFIAMLVREHIRKEMFNYGDD